MENERTASDVVVRAIPAAEHEQFDPASLGQFWSGRWKITAESDRYGYRLAGEPLRRIEAVDIRSHGIVPGVIQVPPSGQPIVQMRDAQPSGGYPKIATVIDADLWRLGQAGGGTWVRFARVDYSQALAAGERKQAYLKQVRWLSHLYASAGGEVAPCPAT
jgi:allophanate hydrolase subunit 2